MNTILIHMTCFKGQQISTTQHVLQKLRQDFHTVEIFVTGSKQIYVVFYLNLLTLLSFIIIIAMLALNSFHSYQNSAAIEIALEIKLPI